MSITARLNPRHQEMIREKIRASQILNVLEEHILDGRVLSKSQVSAALGLLKKCVPDLTATTISDPDGEPVSLLVGFVGTSKG
jgi:hypothetical protein